MHISLLLWLYVLPILAILLKGLKLLRLLFLPLPAWVKLVCLLAASKGLENVLDLDNYRKVVIPVGLLMIVLSLIIFTNVMEMFDWTLKIYNYYAFSFQVILPVIIWITAEVKVRSQNRAKDNAKHISN